MDQNQQIIKEINQNFQEALLENYQENKTKIYIVVSKFYSKIKRMKNKLNQNFSLSKDTDFEDEWSSSQNKMIKKAKKQATQNIWARFVNEQNGISNEVIALMWEGYSLIMTLREYFTGQNISYNVGWIDNKEKSLIIGQFTRKELRESLSIFRQTFSYNENVLNPVLKLTTSLKAKYEKKPNQSSLDDYILYSNISSYLFKKRVKINKGRVFEVFMNFKAQGITNPTHAAISRMYNKVNKDTSKFYEGGDIGLTELKSLIGNSPSIASFSTIFLAIGYIYKILKQAKQEKISDNEIIKLMQDKFNFNQKLESSYTNIIEDAFKDIEQMFNST